MGTRKRQPEPDPDPDRTPTAGEGATPPPEPAKTPKKRARARRAGSGQAGPPASIDADQTKVERPEPPPDPWELQPGEPVDAFAAFVEYRDAGPGRTLAKVAVKFGKSPTWIELLSRTWHWVDRVRAWVKLQDDMVRLAKLEALIEMNQRHATVAKGMVIKVVEKLQKLDLDEMKPSDVARWFEVAVKVERLTLGEETDIVRQKFSLMSDEDLMDYLRQNMPVGSLPPAPSEEENDGS